MHSISLASMFKVTLTFSDIHRKSKLDNEGTHRIFDNVLDQKRLGPLTSAGHIDPTHVADQFYGKHWRINETPQASPGLLRGKVVHQINNHGKAQCMVYRSTLPHLCALFSNKMFLKSGCVFIYNLYSFCLGKMPFQNKQSHFVKSFWRSMLLKIYAFFPIHAFLSPHGPLCFIFSVLR